VDEETRKLVRLFPIRFRRLPPEAQFDRYDQVEMTVTKANDARVESFRVDEGSIRITSRATSTNFPDRSRVGLWSPLISESMEALEDSQQNFGTSLGIICPQEPEFCHEPLVDAGKDDQSLVNAQHLMFEEPLKPLPAPKYRFYYRFSSAGKLYHRTILDWEVQAAFANFRQRYETEDIALDMLYEQYANRIPQQNLHFVMGTMAKRPFQFILIGLLRSPLSPKLLNQQQDLFA
jgi:hypothetical protein